jgi:hypothetical protein
MKGLLRGHQTAQDSRFGPSHAANLLMPGVDAMLVGSAADGLVPRVGS